RSTHADRIPLELLTAGGILVPHGIMLSAAGCSGEPCPVLRRALGNGATPAGNTAMLALFAALIPPAIYVGLRYRARPHASLLLLALLVDVVGHVAKVLLVGD